MQAAPFGASRNEAPGLLVVGELPMSKRIVLVDAFGYELFSGASVAPLENETPREPEVTVEAESGARDGLGGYEGSHDDLPGAVCSADQAPAR